MNLMHITKIITVIFQKVFVNLLPTNGYKNLLNINNFIGAFIFYFVICVTTNLQIKKYTIL